MFLLGVLGIGSLSNALQTLGPADADAQEKNPHAS